jgi:hypothetical protein
MGNNIPEKERGVPFMVLLRPGDLQYAKIGGATSAAAACREGLAPYIRLGKLRMNVVDPEAAPKKPRMEL